MGIEYVSVNAKASYRMDSLLGEAYYVVPMTMIVPGVLSGSDGPLLYPQEAVTANVQDWNGMPITDKHPTNDKGTPVSARSPLVMNQYGIGWVFESNDKDGSLVAEAWVSEKLALAKNPQIIANIKAGKKFELSTGLFKQVSPESGTYNNITYNAKVTKITPDHLAFLTDEKGACSLEDGCGVLVNSRKDVNYLPWMISSDLVVNELSFSDIRDEISKLISEKFSSLTRSTYVVAIYDKYAIFEDYPRYNNDGVKLSNEPTKLYKITYSKTKDVVTLGEEVTEVKYQATYVTVNSVNSDSNPGDNKMSKLSNEERTKLIDQLTVNCGSCEGEKKTFEALSDDTLKALVANKEPKETKTAPVTNSNSGTTGKPAEVAPVITFDSLPPELKALVVNAQRQEAKYKEGLVDDILSLNSKNVFTKEELSAMPIEQLEGMQKLAKAIAPAAPANPFVRANYVGAAGLVTTNSNGGAKLEPLPLPTMNWSTDK